jgi:DNA repair protein RecO (recombination protein O)
LPSFSLTAVNIGTFPLGEADRIITLFSREKGLHRAVAKGARKPGTKMSGKSEVLNINNYLLAKGKSLDIVTQCESIETFPALRKDLRKLTYALYYAELTQIFGAGLSEEAERFFDRLALSIGLMAASYRDPALLCTEFEFALLNMLGLNPELDFCVACRTPLNENNLSSFNHELGGLICQSCFHRMRALARSRPAGQVRQVRQVRDVSEVREELEGDPDDAFGRDYSYDDEVALAARFSERSEAIEGHKANVYVTPLVWKRLILARNGAIELNSNIAEEQEISESAPLVQATVAARRVLQGYMEFKAGRKMKSLELLDSLP